ncbi:hypothetical protein ACDT10_11560 [Mycobacterium intracellulare]|uniref:hypothetical protein n=1 Tax=Mycobacterium intracellulare TaxID=1767 RepID=UPI0035591742
MEHFGGLLELAAQCGQDGTLLGGGARSGGGRGGGAGLGGDRIEALAAAGLVTAAASTAWVLRPASLVDAIISGGIDRSTMSL